MTDQILTVEESRYDRQERITWWDQQLLAASRVLVVGAGALGNEIVKNLVLCGVGHVLVVDFDHVELSNLARCIFFRPADEGRPKAVVLAERAAELNPEVRVDGLVADIRAFGAGLACRADVVVGALDNREARLHLNRVAWRLGRPWVDGAMEALQGISRVFTPPTSCYECTLTEADLRALAHRRSCRLLSRDDLLAGKVPTTATTSSIVGGWQAQEVLKLLHRDRPGVLLFDGALVFDGSNNDAYPLTYSLDEDCPAHHTYEPLDVVPYDGTTFERLVRELGFEAAVVELGDDHLLAWRCGGCGIEVAARGVLSLFAVDDAICLGCGEPRQPVFAASVEVPGPHAELSLAEFGVRADDLLAVRHTTEYRYAWAQSNGCELPAGWRTVA